MKEKYFKNNEFLTKSTNTEIHSPTFTPEIKQWWWKNNEGKWRPFQEEENKRINKCAERYPTSTVVVSISRKYFWLFKIN